MAKSAFRIAAETRPLYSAETEKHLAALPDLDRQSRSGGFGVLMGYRYDLPDPCGTKDIRAAGFQYRGVVFGPIHELAPALRPLVSMAMTALIADTNIDDFMCLTLPKIKGPLALGPDSHVVCMKNVMIIEAGLWPVYRGDDDAYQRQLHTHLRVIVASGLSAHAHIEAVRLARTYITEMAEGEANVDSALLQSSLSPGKCGFNLIFY